MMNLNPQFISMLRSGNPQQIAMNMLTQQSKNNPILQNVIKMYQSGDTGGVEQIARNLAKEKNVNVDELMTCIKNQFYSR